MIIRRPAALLLASAFAAAMLLPVVPAFADAPPPATATQPGPAAPRLVVAISIDQYSADLFAEYRNHFTQGFARLETGAVFPSGFQSHAATETCPGHSTIMTGDHPSRTGIIANNWIDQNAPREKKSVYCAEDETKTAGDPGDYVASVGHLRVPTLGDRLKMVSPKSRNVAVSGKDRAALMMGGHDTDQVWWWKDDRFVTLDGRPSDPAVEAENVAVAKVLNAPGAAFDLPQWCQSRDYAVQAGDVVVGIGRFAMTAGDKNAFRVSPRLDQATLELAGRLVREMKLGKGPATDVLSISLSANDYIGHAYGTEGSEMCIQNHALDVELGQFFAMLDSLGIDYVVALTADHGGFDLPERQDLQAMPMVRRADLSTTPKALGQAIAAKLGIKTDGPLLYGEGVSGDYWVNASLTPEQKQAVIAEARAELAANPEVAAVFTAAEIAAVPAPTGSPETWSLIERARDSFYAPRSGDFLVFLKRDIVTIPKPGPGYVATHGTPWDHDRRVPILFWRKGIMNFEQPNPVETVDIAPTLAALIGLDVKPGEMDGRCLDIDGGPGTTCTVK
ncbi:MAG: alkaline phosphatase family protein [Sphingomonadales bacterium]|nr:alkaline phosphatase family protein [Sphingomonadales bacterium]MDE2569736.1 alkaline phosphatase family protein [Sphingomonadales bacterium]